MRLSFLSTGSQLLLLLLAGAANSKVALRKRIDNPRDFSWVKKWAAVGDSYTAGIGAGELFSDMKVDAECSRYDGSYVLLVNNFLGPTVKNFYYLACSGAVTSEIYEQVQELKTDLDLVMLTAGGNDLCLSSIIKDCILMAGATEEGCDAALSTAQNNIDNILKDNIRSVLTALEPKMASQGIVVFSLYAQFFNTATDECDSESWTFPFQSDTAVMRVTQAQRKRFNSLVSQANKAIQEVVDAVAPTWKSAKLVTSDWDAWPMTVGGQFCEPSASPNPEDKSNKNLQFYKFDTTWQTPADVGKRGLSVEDVFGPQPAANLSNAAISNNNDFAVTSNMAKRGTPSPPNCPAPGGIVGYLAQLMPELPDSVGKIFHPNLQGHITMASFALTAVIDARAEILGVQDPFCTTEEEKYSTRCYKDEDSHAYTSEHAAMENYEHFCDNANDRHDSTRGWSYSESYRTKTPDEHSFTMSVGSTILEMDVDACKKTLRQIIDKCNGNDATNTLRWRFGGEITDGAYTYKFQPARTNRPWPPATEKTQSCKGWYKGAFSAYEIKGQGWLTYDFGEELLKPSIKSCLGLGLTAYSFEYYDEPDDDGNEWKVSFHTPIWVNARCFKNNKVQKGASGPGSGGCGGNDP